MQTTNQNNRSNKTICLACFGDLDQDRVCLKCKKKADDTPSPAHHIPARSVLNNKYLLTKAIGEGRFGITYLAWNMHTGNKIALKEYYPNGYVSRMSRSNSIVVNDKSNHAANARSLQRFMHEAKTLAHLKNTPGIVSVQDFFSANNTAYIAMEHLDGISLKTYHKMHGNLELPTLVDLLLPIMIGLQKIHSLGIIHRDISPDNIIITSDKKVKLIDFGAAKRINLNGQVLSIVLKQGYAPEEQYRSQSEQGPWSDIYALAATMYYCLTGIIPPESISRLHKDTLIKPSDLGCKIGKVQELALIKGLSVHYKNRYSQVVLFKDALISSNPKMTVQRLDKTKIKSNTTNTVAKSMLYNKLLKKNKIGENKCPKNS
jgi:serine/threonine protein kinase